MTEIILLNLDVNLRGSDVRSLAGSRWRKRETSLPIIFLEMEEVMPASCVHPTSVVDRRRNKGLIIRIMHSKEEKL